MVVDPLSTGLVGSVVVDPLSTGLVDSEIVEPLSTGLIGCVAVDPLSTGLVDSEIVEPLSTGLVGCVAVEPLSTDEISPVDESATGVLVVSATTGKLVAIAVRTLAEISNDFVIDFFIFLFLVKFCH